MTLRRVGRWFLVGVGVVGSIIGGIVAATADVRRVALVIGNSSYAKQPLTNPVNDAIAIAQALTDLGFSKVLRADNVTKARMEAALSELGRESVGADTAVVFFAGHGTERDGKNYLIPVDARLDRASDLDLQAIPLATVLGQIGGATRLRLVILDACRSNPFPLAGNRRSTSVGLARVDPEDNTLVAYAARDGTTAFDGAAAARHSPFTAALLRHIKTPDLDVRFMFGHVRDEVRAATQREQEPHVYGTLGGAQVPLAPWGGRLSGSPPPVVTTAPRPPTALARRSGCTPLAVDFSAFPLVTGDTICDETGQYTAKVEQIGQNVIRFSQSGGPALSCAAGVTCVFAWPRAPIFRIEARSDPARGIAPEGTILPR